MSRSGSLSRSNKPSVEWAGVILTNPEGHILLNLRGPEKALFPDCWDVIGGTLEQGETPEACMLRELQEETGEMLMSAGWFRDYEVPLADGTFGCLHLFSGILDKPAGQLVVGEGLEHRFFALHELPDLKLAPGMSQVLKEFVESQQYQTCRNPGVSTPTSR